ncbi:Sec-independent protein translocase protein TatCy [Paenibacillus baekrokdamisoli]|uniref:Sec-independent protein translocase protein TatC n=1 Tax=Paenibacillus baekrokdamisoli TaxID=1712516 RepID=A0A3G9JF75_9BACL|nr:twin-arginine translocase subunit TatC [Paenibacillus baekrokdamisoli]MBB3068797.1 sec-independent protein translocase protein TatC [Paenibacillus baekrokdamisoli]BBH23623.1 Sec-independent protein translocase protein TatCy [Paenibacillus baekrokdamisoli]
MQPNQMSLVDHLGEIRKRLIWILLAMAVAMIAGFIVAKPILRYFKSVEPASGIEWNAFTPWDGLRVYMQAAFLLSFVVTGPLTLYHLWAFAKPGLDVPEQKAALRYIPYSAALFAIGLSFSYFIVFPLTFKFTSSFNESLELKDVYGITQYFSFMFNILLPISLLFEMPLIIMFLTRLRLLNPALLKKTRRYAYMAQLLISTLITPPDVISVLIVAIPLIVLYEISVVLSGYVHSKQAKND